MTEQTKSIILLFFISLVLIPSFIYGASSKHTRTAKEENVQMVLTPIKDCAESSKSITALPQSSLEDADINFPYISGYTNNNFRPNQAVTREELATMMARIITKNRIPNEENQFSDVVANRFSTDAVNYITRLGIMEPVSVDKFNPNGTVSYKGFQEIVSQLMPYIKEEQVGLPTGNGNLTRVQAVVAFNKLFRVQCNTTYTDSPFTDINKNTPYYDDIVCATSPRAENGY